MHDADPVCAFSGGRARGSVSGLRRRFGSGAGHQVPAFKKRAHGVCILLFIREGSTASLSNCLMA